MKLTKKHRVSRNKDKVFKEMGEELYILDEVGNNLISLNSSGQDIWRFLDQDRSVAEIAQHLSTLYETEADLTADVIDFIQYLDQYKLVQIK